MWESCLYGSERAWVATESVRASRERPFYSNAGFQPVVTDKNKHNPKWVELMISMYRPVFVQPI